MATRLRFHRATNNRFNGPVYPVFSNSWSITAGSQYLRNMLLETGNNSIGNGSTGFYETSATNPWNLFFFSGVTSPLAAQTISGTVKMQLTANESDAAMNAYVAVIIRVVDFNGAYKATLLAFTVDGTEVVADASYFTNRTVLAGASLTSYACSAGDRIVVEVGVQAKNTKTTAYYSYICSGADSGQSDLPENDTLGSLVASQYCGWIEFSATLNFDTVPTVSPNTADAAKFYTDAAPVLEFTGTDADGASLVYRFDANTSNNFPSTLADATNDNDPYSVGGSGTYAVYFSADGTKMYVALSTSINQYTLSTAWDVSTASYSTAKNLGYFIYSMFFKPDGTKVYVTSGSSIYCWTLSTAWNISTATSTNSYFVGQSCYGIFFSPDGVYFFTMIGSPNELRKYTMGTAWDVTTASLTTNTIIEIYLGGMWFSSDGLTMVLSGDNIDLSSNKLLIQYALPAAWDITSYRKVATVTGQFYGATFSADMTKMYVPGLTTSIAQWTSHMEPASVYFSKISDTDSGFANTVVYSPVDTSPFTSGDKVSYTYPAPLSAGTYYWRARAKDTAGQWSTGSTVRSFTVEEPPIYHPPVATATLTTLVPTYSVAGTLVIPTAEAMLTALVPTYDLGVRVVSIPTVTLSLAGHAPSYLNGTGVSSIRSEANILNAIMYAPAGAEKITQEVCFFDTTHYTAAHYYFEVVAKTTVSQSVTIYLRKNYGYQSDVQALTIPAGTLTPTRIRVEFTPITGPCRYDVRVPSLTGTDLYLYNARVIIIQSGAPIMRTESHYEIGTRVTGISDNSVAPLPGAKYWKYVASRHSYVYRVSADAIAFITTAGTGYPTVILQEDDGSFGNWTQKCVIVSQLAQTTPWCYQGPYFTPTDGRHYRIATQGNNLAAGRTLTIAGARIILRQQSGYDWVATDPTNGLGIDHVTAMAMSDDGQFIVAQVAKTGGGYFFAKSTNGGATWAEWTAYTDTNPITEMACDNDASGILTISGTKAWRRVGDNFYSYDNAYGKTWTACDVDASGAMFILGDEDSHLYTTESGNFTYYQIGGGITGKYRSIAAVKWDGVNACRMHVALEASSSQMTYYWTADAGQHWYEFFSYTGTLTYPARVRCNTNDGFRMLFSTPDGKLYRAGIFGDSPAEIQPAGAVTGEWIFDINADGNYMKAALHGGRMYESSDGGVTWTETRPNGDANHEWSLLRCARGGEAELNLAAESDGGVWLKAETFIRLENIEKHAMIETSLNDTNGAGPKIAYHDPAEWGYGDYDAFHVIDAPTGDSSSAKVLQTMGGSTTDVTNSTATGTYSAESSQLILPTQDAAELTVDVLDQPIYGSRIIYLATLTTGPVVVPPAASMTLNTQEPTIYPLKLVMPAAALPLTGQVTTHYIPPTIYNYPPAASMSILCWPPTHIWAIGAEAALLAGVIYRLILTGAPDLLADLELPLSSFTAAIHYATPSYLSCVIHPSSDEELEIAARSNGELVVYKGYRFPDGVEQVEEIARSAFDDYRRDTGARHSAASISGYKTITPGQQKEILAANVLSLRTYSNGKRCIVADIDLFLKCGDIYVYGTGGNDYFIVGTIELSVSAKDRSATMTVTEM